MCNTINGVEHASKKDVCCSVLGWTYLHSNSYYSPYTFSGPVVRGLQAERC